MPKPTGKIKPDDLVKVEIIRNTGCGNRILDAGKTVEIPYKDALELVNIRKAIWPGDALPKGFVPQGERLEIKQDTSQFRGADGQEPAAAGVPSEKLTEPQKIERIVAAIYKLNPDDKTHFTGKGEPAATALTELVGFQVTKKLRDAAHKIVLADDGAEGQEDDTGAHEENASKDAA